MAVNLKQTVTFNADPKTVYDYLTNSRKHAQFTGEPAKVTKKAGDKFTAYDGYIEGMNIELQPNKKIVQAWRGKNWPKGIYSIVTYSFKREKGGKTKLSFEQCGVPTNHAKRIRDGWSEHYWTPLKEELRERKRRRR